MRVVYTGIVESRMDPMELGRCQVRIHDLHTYDKNVLPTSDLPWAYPMGSISSASISGIGESPTGVVEGTTVLIIFRDRDQQQPIMIGTMGGIPQGEGSYESEAEPLLNGESMPVTTETGIAVTTSPTPATTVTPTVLGIPGKPPFGPRVGTNTKISSSATSGILAIAAAMDALGVTGSYARAAILGIVGGECEWIPRTEGYKYSLSRIQEVFTWMSAADAQTYANWKGAPGDFFNFVYGPTTRSGRNLGNKNLTDGANYCGRGYIQLTGAANYTRYAKLSGIDILSNPELMNSSSEGALVTVAYIKDRVKLSQNDPGFFDAACAAVGYNVPNIKAKKTAYYQYFLLGDPNSPTQQALVTTAEAGAQPDNVVIAKTGLPSDRQQNIIIGFRDPNMKYPLRELLYEPDTNRLARGKTQGTSVQTRDNTRTLSVETADYGNWSQPPIPYNAKYPHNQFYSSESGHVQEFDDTPGNERVNTMHRSGTFVEVDANGTQVNRIIGDGYEIIDRNGYVYVKGAFALTAEGTTAIFVNADATIRVAGDTVLEFQQDLDMSVAGNYSLVVGGNYTQSVLGSKTTNVSGNNSEGVLGNKSTGVGGTDAYSIGGSKSLKVGGDYTASVASLSIGSAGSIGLNASGGVGIDGSKIDLNGGVSSSVNVPSISMPSMPAAPTLGVPESNRFENLTTPPRNFEIDSSFETPEEINTTAGVAFHKKRDAEIVGGKTDAKKVVAEAAAPAPANNTVATGKNCDLINNMTDFPMGLKLSERFSLGSLIMSPKHVIADQMLQDSRTSAPRKYTKQEIVCNLKGVAENIMEPLVNLIPGGRTAFTITSGYRYAGLTANESKVSDHPKGNAVDIVLTGKNFDYQAHYDLAVMLAAALPFHQMILEYRDPGRPGNSRDKRIVWLHISHRYVGAQKQAFTMLNDQTYGQGFHLLGK